VIRILFLFFLNDYLKFAWVINCFVVGAVPTVQL